MKERSSVKTSNSRILGRLKSIREVIIFGVAVGVFMVFFFTTKGNIVSPEGLRVISVAVSELGLIAIGITMLMISGEFDLSVGSVSALGALVTAEFYQLGLNPFLALIIALGVGIAAGAINGLITVKFGLPSFIVTLGAMIAWRGVIYIVTAGSTLGFRVMETHPAFYNFLVGKVGVIPVPIIWFIVSAIILMLILNFHRFGNHVYAVGGNKETARAMGINTDKTKVICFMLVGMFSTFVGVMRVTRIRGFHALQGSGIELTAIAAVVIGGTLLTGGVGTIIGACLGTMVITILEYGLIMSRVSAYLYKLVLGIIIVLVVIINKVFERRREK
ncbi:Inner membrane ABC transporter permease protein YjfF [subsurface metagenome]